MRKKRKGSETDASTDLGVVNLDLDHAGSVGSSNLKSHYSLEDCCRLKKRCKEDADIHIEFEGSFKSRLAGIATAPPFGTSSLITPTRGLKRKIGCIDVATQMGRKKKIDDDYVTGEAIGQGKFGSVYLCRSRGSGAESACKTLKKGEETVHREVEIMQHLSGHSGVVTLQAVYEEAECFHLVMELCSGGRLIDQMLKEGPFSEQRAANTLKEVMLVIKYCHDMGVVHRDIKPENILLTKLGKLKLADFGLAMRISEGDMQTLFGYIFFLVSMYSTLTESFRYLSFCKTNYPVGMHLHCVYVCSSVLIFVASYDIVNNVFEGIKSQMSFQHRL